MTIAVDVPGGPSLRIERVLLDVNGTLTDRGRLLPGVATGIARLRHLLEVRLLSADTYGTLDRLTTRLGVEGKRVGTGAEKRALVMELGPSACAAIGNGRNDAEMLAEVALGIAVLGPEGLHRSAAAAAELICPSIEAALELLADPQALIATLRP